MDATQWIGIGASVFTSVSMIPQLVKVIKEKKSEGVSIFMVAVLISGLSLWIWYGVMKEDYPIIFTNAFSLAVNMVLIVFGIKYKRKK